MSSSLLDLAHCFFSDQTDKMFEVFGKCLNYLSMGSLGVYTINAKPSRESAESGIFCLLLCLSATWQETANY